MSEQEARSAASVRYMDFPTQLATPSELLTVELQEGERIVSVETVKDYLGYATARVWIVKEAS